MQIGRHRITPDGIARDVERFLVGVAQNHTAGFAQTLCQLRHRVRAIGTVLAAVGFAMRISPKVDSSVMTVRL